MYFFLNTKWPFSFSNSFQQPDLTLDNSWPQKKNKLWKINKNVLLYYLIKAWVRYSEGMFSCLHRNTDILFYNQVSQMRKCKSASGKRSSESCGEQLQQYGRKTWEFYLRGFTFKKLALPLRISYIKINDRHYFDSLYLTTEQYDTVVKTLNSEVRQQSLKSGSKANYLSDIIHISENEENC